MDITTSALSQFENSETLRKSTVEKIAKALEVPADLIENFDEQTTLQIFTNCEGGHVSGGCMYNNTPLFKRRRALN